MGSHVWYYMGDVFSEKSVTQVPLRKEGKSYQGRHRTLDKEKKTLIEKKEPIKRGKIKRRERGC